MQLKVNIAVALLAAVACTKAPSGGGPVIAEGKGITVTAGELLARLDEQPPSVRQTFTTPERKKAFLDTVLRFEVLARRAEQEGLASDPEVQFALKKVLVAKYYERYFKHEKDGSGVTSADIRSYYDEHLSEFQRPGRVHAWHVFLAAEQGSDRAAKAAQAKKLLARILAEETNDPRALAAAARESSDEATTRPLGGDLGFKTKEELEVYGKPLAEAAFKLGIDQTSPVAIETPAGFHLLRVTEQQPEMTRSVTEVSAIIAARLSSARRLKEYDELLKRLVDEAKISVHEAELAKLSVPPIPGAGG
jgi:peptidyl-prolyl cis-trans isomerase C